MILFLAILGALRVLLPGKGHHNLSPRSIPHRQIRPPSPTPCPPLLRLNPPTPFPQLNPFRVTHSEGGGVVVPSDESSRAVASPASTPTLQSPHPRNFVRESQPRGKSQTSLAR